MTLLYTLVVDLLESLVLLLALAYIYVLIEPFYSRVSPFWRSMTMGAVFGAIAAISIENAAIVAPGVRTDLRAPILLIAGSMAGFRAGIAAGLIAGLYRLAVGGAGAWLGVGAIVSCALLGAFYGRFVKGHFTGFRFLALGFVGWAVNAFWFVPLIPELGRETIVITTAALALLTPSSTWLLGMLLLRERRLATIYQSVADSELLFRTMFENSGAGITIVDLSGRLQDANPAFAQMLGHTRDDLIGLNFETLTAADDVPRERALIQQVIATGEKFYEIEKRYIHKAGHPIWVRMTGSARYDSDGQLIGGLAVTQDITQRKQAEDALRASEERFRALFNQTFQWMSLLQPDGTVVLANQTALTFADVTLDAVVGQPFWETLWWRHSEAAQLQLREAIRRAAEGEFVRYEVVVSGQRDRTLTIDFSLQPVRDREGRVTLLISEARDMTDRKLAEEHAVTVAIQRERLAMLRRFLTDASHNLRTPITVLMSSTYLLERALQGTRDGLSASDPARLDEALTRAEAHLRKFQNQLELLRRIVQEMVDLVRLEAPDLREMEQADLCDILRQVLEAVRSACDRHGLNLRHDLPDTPLVSQWAVDDIRQMIDILIRNAIQFTPAGGAISVRLYPDRPGSGEHPMVIIEVRDTGVGIAESDLPYIFDAFYLGSRSLQHHAVRTGLGLTIAQRIALLHGGRLTVESVPDQGSTFRAYLPPNPEAQNSAR